MLLIAGEVARPASHARGLGAPGHERVHADAGLPQFECECLREVVESGLGRVVDEIAAVDLEGVRRTDHDDAPAGHGEIGHAFLYEKEGGLDIDGEHGCPVLLVEVGTGPVHDGRSVVDEDVDPSPARAGGIRESFRRRCRRRQVGPDIEGLEASGREIVDDTFDVIGLATVHDDATPGRGEGRGGCPSDPRG